MGGNPHLRLGDNVRDIRDDSLGCQRGSHAGWSSLIVLITFLGGANMLLTGILGVYIGRIHAEAKRRPLYVIDRAVGFETETDAARSTSRRALRA
jgi:hypothetical protein